MAARYLTFVLFALLPQTYSQTISVSIGICPGTGGSKWVSKGCYTDQSGRARALGRASYVDDHDMTVETCLAFCANGGYNYAGVEFGKECYCDYAIQPSGNLVSHSDCNMACSGNSNEKCGAGGRLNIYYNGGTEPTSPRKVGDWRFTGCFVDNVEDRALERAVGIPAGVTVEYCTKACKSAGFQYAGMEYGGECYCGNTFDASQVSATECRMACDGNHSQLCGGPDRLTVYHDDSVRSGSHSSV